MIIFLASNNITLNKGSGVIDGGEEMIFWKNHSEWTIQEWEPAGLSHWLSHGREKEKWSLKLKWKAIYELVWGSIT